LLPGDIFFPHVLARPVVTTLELGVSMGYSEVCCQLCGISFNIGRVRKAGEPLSAGFFRGEQGFFPEACFVSKECSVRNRCPREAGCLNVKTTRRRKLDGRAKVKADVPDTWLVCDGDEVDLDWEYESDIDDEPLEWQEDCDNSDAAGAEDSDSDSESSGSDEYTPKTTVEMDIDIAFQAPDEDSPEEEDSDSSDGDDAFMRRFEKCNLLEHIAGPGCAHPRGYNGHNITSEEMIGSGTVQCLIKKISGWQREATDEDWEVTSDYFLSGLGGYMQSRDYGGVKCLPLRHGVEEELYPDNMYWEGWGKPEWDTPMPFHPWCLEVFKRVSHQHFGFFNVNGLGRWRWAECHNNGKQVNHRFDPVLNRGLQQEWHHENGDEWLAANPVLVPALPEVLQPSIVEDATSFSPKDSAFSVDRAELLPGLASESVRDPFKVLPRELINLINTYLDSRDIAALRLSSRAFTHLPLFLWKQLLIKEMPWLWELWDDSNTSKWALVSSSELHSESKRLHRVAEEMRNMQGRHRHIIQQEIPEHYDQFCAERPWVLEDVDSAINPALAQSVADMARLELICKLPRERTNWFVVYTQITRHWKDLKGLKNRERIWKCCEDITQRIQSCMNEGKIEF
jgi:hypothetical protein